MTNNMMITRITYPADPKRLAQVIALYEDFTCESGFNVQNFRAWLDRYLPDQNLHLSLCMDADRAVGYLLAWYLPECPIIVSLAPTGYLSHCYVTPAYRGQGVGKALFTAICQWFRMLHVEQVTLHTINDDARRYWEHRGFGTPHTRLKLELKTI